MVWVSVVQATAILVTFAPASVPLPLATVQVWLSGCTNTATLYAEPSAMAPNVNGAFAGTMRLVVPFSLRVKPVPLWPVTVPPIVKLLVTQLTATLVTFALPTVPEPLVTVQLWLGLVGCVRTVTL